jgi:AcrR family transcriptional regulator
LSAQLARGAILAAAMQEFSRRGVKPTRVEDLLLAAGIARRTFYRYFSGKEEVLAALYEVATGELVKAIEAAQTRQDASPLAGIRLGIDTFLDFHRDNARAVRELLELAMRSDSQLAPRRRWLRARLVRILDQAVHKLDGRRLDPFVYVALVSALEGLSLELLQTRSTPADIERVRAVVHALVDRVLGLPRAAKLPARR